MVKYRELQSGDRVRLLWIDSDSTSEWQNSTDFDKMGERPLVTIEATIYKRIKHGVLIYNAKSEDGEQYGGCWFIPRVCIKTIERLP